MAVAGPALSLEFFPWALSMEVLGLREKGLGIRN
jgi:hypothetical protein